MNKTIFFLIFCIKQTMKSPLCTLINNSCSFFYSVYLEHCKSHIFTGSEYVAVTSHFLDVHYDTNAIYITNSQSLQEVEASITRCVENLRKYCPDSHTRIYIHWPDFELLNNALCAIATSITNETILVKCMQPKMIDVATRCLDKHTVTPLMLSAMFDCYRLKHLTGSH